MLTSPLSVYCSVVSIMILYTAGTVYSSYYSVYPSDEETMHVCTNYTAIIKIERIFVQQWVQYETRFQCQEGTQSKYHPGDWIEGIPDTMTGSMRYHCKRDHMLAGVEVNTSSEGRVWSFFCSSLTDWTITEICQDFELEDYVTASPGTVFVGLEDTSPLNIFNHWIIQSCKLRAAVSCNTSIDCNSECCQYIHIPNAEALNCNGSGLMVKCKRHFYWTGPALICSYEYNSSIHSCKECYGSSFIDFCIDVFCSQSGYYQCRQCLPHHPKKGWPLITNKNGLKCRSPARIKSFEVVKMEQNSSNCFAYYLQCRTTGQKPVHIYVHNIHVPTIKYKLEKKHNKIVVITCERNKTFVCYAENRHGNDSQTISLINNFVPIVVDNTTAIYVHSGHEVSLHCITEGNIFHYRWYYEGNLLLDNATDYTLQERQASLIFHSVTKSDTGNYRCQVWNALNYYEKEVWLAVVPPLSIFHTGEDYHANTSNYPPHIINFQSNYFVHEGQSVNLSCTVTGLPRPVLVWSKHNKILYPTLANYHFDTNRGLLTLANISVHDIGSYKCSALNYISTDIQFANLFLIRPSTSFTLPTYSVTVSSNITHHVPIDETILHLLVDIYSSLVLMTVFVTLLVIFHLKCII